MTRFWIIITALLLTSCTGEQPPDLYLAKDAAPELIPVETDAPIINWDADVNVGTFEWVRIENNGVLVLSIPENAPATGSGDACQILIGAEFKPPFTPNTLGIEWSAAADLDDGVYVGLLEIRDGVIQPCPVRISLDEAHAQFEAAGGTAMSLGMDSARNNLYYYLEWVDAVNYRRLECSRIDCICVSRGAAGRCP